MGVALQGGDGGVGGTFSSLSEITSTSSESLTMKTERLRYNKDKFFMCMHVDVYT